jgi:hypothetical protein
MKIFWSFNTKLDEQELYEAIQKNGQWNAIMMKKHWIYLIRPLIRMSFAFAAFGLLIYFAYHQFYKDYKLLFWVITTAYSLVTLFRCVHSFSMILHDILDQKNNKNWYVETVSQSEFKEWRYEKFLKHTFISMCLQVLIMIGCSITSFSLWNITWTGVILSIIWIIVNIWFLFLLYKVLDRIIDYEMDFNIFTTDQFIIYRQHGFFKTESTNIATSTIKIVKDSKSWIRWSFFNFWKVSIHPEGNLNNSKAIELFYVPSPKALTKKLNEFIEKSKEWLNVSLLS